MAAIQPNPRQPVFLFDMARHRSHLVFRYIGTHPDVQDIWHPFLPAFLLGPERITLRTKNPVRDGDQHAEWIPPSSDTDTYAENIQEFLSAVKEAQDQGKVPVINEHSQMALQQDITLALLRKETVDMPPSFNPTVIPDHILDSLIPVFVIRNPIYVVPSNYIILTSTSQLRPDGEDWRAATGMPIQRRLFDYFRERNNGKAPLLIDGDDVVWRTEELRDNLAKALDLDPAGFSSVWDAVPQEKRIKHPVLRLFLQTIDDSTGIERPSEQRPDADLDRTYEKWIGEYGQEVAGQLRGTVVENMPHYEYMAQFKL